MNHRNHKYYPLSILLVSFLLLVLPFTALSSPSKTNHNGKIMILMYHDIGYPEATWRRTPENLKKDLTVLYNNGYRAVSLNDYVTNNIKIPIGTTPVVITFDDGTAGQFTFIKQNDTLIPDKKSGVGILEQFYTVTHKNFKDKRNQTEKIIQKEIGKQAKYLQSMIDNAN